MPKVIVVHSYRSGAGSSNITANLAVLLATRGARVGVIDADVAAPGLHLLFGITGDALTHTFNTTYWWNQGSIEETVYDATYLLSDRGRLFVVPSSPTLLALTRIAQKGYNPERLMQACKQLSQALDLDYLFIDTAPGIETAWIAFSDFTLLVMRPDQQDFQGTATILTTLKDYRDRTIQVIVNQVPDSAQAQSLKEQIERAYRVPVAGIFAWTPELAQIGSSRLFGLHYPEHPLTIALRSIVAQIVS